MIYKGSIEVFPGCHLPNSNPPIPSFPGFPLISLDNKNQIISNITCERTYNYITYNLFFLMNLVRWPQWCNESDISNHKNEVTLFNFCFINISSIVELRWYLFSSVLFLWQSSCYSTHASSHGFNLLLTTKQTSNSALSIRFFVN